MNEPKKPRATAPKREKQLAVAAEMLRMVTAYCQTADIDLCVPYPEAQIEGNADRREIKITGTILPR
jgi:hypothetical protein